jgi:Na+/proline symporter
VQAVMVFVLVLILSIAVYVYIPIETNAIVTSGAADATPSGFSAAVVLILAITSAEMFNAASWQRVWSARDSRSMIVGVAVASTLIVIVIILVGVIGMAAVALYGNALFEPEYIAFLAAFLLVAEMPIGWHVVLIIATVCLVASSADSLQNGMAALVAKSERVTMTHARILTVLLNAPAILLATLQLSVLGLFILADLLAAATIVPIVLGFWYKTHPKAAMAGCVTGLVTAIVVFIVGGYLEYGDAVAALASYGNLNLGSGTLIAAFVLSPFFAGAVTVGVSLLMPSYKFAGFVKVEASPAAAKEVEGAAI